LNKCALELLHDNTSYSRFIFWKECDKNKIDVPDNNTSLYLKEGFISGLFSIYNNNEDFYIQYDIIKPCFKCEFYKKTKKLFSKCLVDIAENLLNFKDIVIY